MRRVFRLLSLAVLAGLGLTPTRPAIGQAAPFGGSQWKGVGSCGSLTCHNAGGPVGMKGSEYTTWVAVDPHGRAHAVLSEARSQNIEAIYRKDSPGMRAESDTLCLSCHVHPRFAASTHDENFAVEDGVGCEGCHGPAGGWLSAHTTNGWKYLPDSTKAAYGLRPLKDLRARAEACVSCHVGDAEAEVDHDLIAAGHPRLNFELGGYLGIYHANQHWDDREDKARHPDHEARAWAIGQVVTAKAALDLLKERATRAVHLGQAQPKAASVPWPEFSEYGCYACHKQLGGRLSSKGSVAGLPNDAAGRSGALPWGTWSLPMVRDLGRQAIGNGSRRADSLLRKLDELMARPEPPAVAVAQQAKAASQALDGWLATLQGRSFDAATSRHLLSTFAEEGARGGIANWDHAAQRYLALAALYHAIGDQSPDRRDSRLKDDLGAIVKRLQFPSGFDSRRDFDAGAVRRAFSTFQSHLGR